MHTYELTLSSPVSTSFRCQKAADSMDIDVSKKSQHHIKIKTDFSGEWDLGLVVGASGSGKTTLAKHIWGDECFKTLLKDETPIIEQFPESMTYEDCALSLNGVGLTQVPCWIRPAYTLSNGQRARAEIALQMAHQREKEEITVVDEWTSVVDRTVAKVMSHCVAKHVRRTPGRVVLLSCHYDVLEWLDPDWIIDCNKQTFVDRRLLQPEERKRKERLEFTVREIDGKTWPFFSKYHYLSERLPGGITHFYGLFCGEEQIGFQCYANYVPHKKQFKRKGARMLMHSNRVVIHPDYAGFGLGLRFINTTAQFMWDKGFDVWAKLSSTPLYRAHRKDSKWKLMDVSRSVKTQVGKRMDRKTGFREKVRTFSFRYVGGIAQGTAREGIKG